ncbi:hypothetical protein [Acidimangrovimonas sediminis]|uniref:hypothetical protein n=1 Tax=Acidimangrovimonas sediminis TaxID=2056283 RepID=UPI000C80A09A|nr:hypothetical protein [Acidimangrovimonas sediminis]
MTGLAPEHEIHRRRFGRNLGLGLALLFFVILVFALTIVKVGEQPAPLGAAPALQGQAHGQPKGQGG